MAKKPIKLYKSYHFKGQDPVIGEVKRLFEESGQKIAAVKEESGVSSTTMRLWFNGKTKYPRSATIEAAGRALGYKREWKKL